MSIYSRESLDFKRLAEALFAKRILSVGLETFNDLSSTEEFQVLRIISLHEPVSTEIIESKYSTQFSLPMILSNLQNENLIVQTSDNKLKLSDLTTQILNQVINQTSIDESKREEEIKLLEKKKYEETRKKEYLQMADALVGTTYIPQDYTLIDDLYKVPELEVLRIIKTRQPIKTDDIEQYMTMEASISMIISNLQADLLISQTGEFAWELSTSFMDKLEGIKVEVVEEEKIEEIEDTPQIGISVNEAVLLETRQLLQAIIDSNYFKDQVAEEIIKTPEFKILNVINAHGPITTSEIDEKIDIEIPMTFLLSNLNADNLIFERENAWLLADDFRRQIQKIKISRDETIEQLLLEEIINKEVKVPVSEPQKEEVIEDIVPSPVDESELISDEIVQVEEQHEDEISIDQITTDPIAKLLIELKYIQPTELAGKGLTEFQEYRVLTIIKHNYPVSTEVLQEKLDIPSLSLVLSNLQADGLIEQDSNFNYTVSGKLKDLVLADSS
ncbi:MAG: hypothetical protein ACXAD7_19700, partial [Candidatus Kariarchaeaceae archaeon]